MNRVLNPTILGIRLSMLLRMYAWRLRRNTAQELLAAGGIAVGVALVFGVLLANASLTGSAEQLVHSIAGGATLQMTARSEAGMPEALARRASRVAGVRVAAPVLRRNVELVGPRGKSSVRLVGVTPQLVELGGSATQNLGAGAELIAGGVGLPSHLAEAIGARPGHRVEMEVAGRQRSVLVRVVLGPSTIGAVAESSIAVALLPAAQRMLGQPRRVSQVLIEPRPGRAALALAGLRRLAAGRIGVSSSEHELSLLKATAKPSEQATTMFAALGGMVGFLLTFAAMLLTTPERRRHIADLRMQGYDWRQALLIVAFEATLLGSVASIVGIAIGYVLSDAFFGGVPVYLAFAFPVGSQQVLTPGSVLLAFAAGVLATLLASAQVALDLTQGRARDAVLRARGASEAALHGRFEILFGALGLGLVLLVTAMVLISPRLTLLGGVLLAVATFVLIPFVFALSAWALDGLGEHLSGSAHVLAARELRATPVRSIALAGVAGLAVFGSVAVGGARGDLIRGLDTATVQFFSSAQVWVTTGMNDLTTTSFRPGDAVRKIAKLPFVKSVRVYQGGLLDVGRRRLWIRARPPGDSVILQRSQMVKGSYEQATRLIRGGGYAAVSEGFASERGLRVGSSFTLPTPSGAARLAVAAVTTNAGWPPGAITLSTADYSRWWHSRQPAALEVSTKGPITPAAAARKVRAALADNPALSVQSVQERDAQFERNARQGLHSLSQISTLLLVAAALAVAAALSASIWQRRPRLASLKVQGFDRRQLWRALLLESAIVLGAGCLVGAVLGVYGHALAARELRLTTGFPAPFTLSELQLLLTLASVAGIAMVVIAVPGLAAARVPVRASFQE